MQEEQEIIETPEVDSNATIPVEDAVNPTIFEYGDLWLKCKCGADVTVAKGFKNAVSLIMATKSDSFWALGCNECGSKLTLYFKESDEETIVEVKEKEKENESIRERDNTETISEGVSDDAERNDGTDNEGVGSTDVVSEV